MYPKMILGDVDLNPSNDQTTVHWKIENFSSIKTSVGSAINSPAFRITHLGVKNLTWKLELYPGGRREQSEKYMGLYLQYLGKCHEVLLSFSLSILDDKHNNVSTRCIKEKLFKTNTVYGTCKLCLKKVIFDEKKNALINDTLLISCTITVKNTVSNNDKQLNEDKSIRAHFENLLESGDMSDVTFEIGEEKLHLHKAILTSLSPVFLAMFQHQMKENQDSIVQIVDVDSEIMKELFRYIYARKVSKIESIAGDLLAAADKYDVQGLKLMCEKALIEQLSVENALQQLSLAMDYNTTILKSTVIEFVIGRLEELVNRPEFEQMDGICKGELLRAMAKKTSTK